VAYATSTNSLSSALSSYNTYLIRSVTLAPFSLSSSLKTSIISRLSIKSAILPSLFAFVYIKWLIILKYPLLLQAQQHAYTVAFILLSSEVIPLYSCCSKEGLVYIVIAVLSSYQPSFYSKCTSINIWLSCNICLVFNAKYTFYIYFRLYSTYSSNRNT